MKNRRYGRDLALKVIFELDVAGGDPSDAFELAVQLLKTDPEEGDGLVVNDDAVGFARELLSGTIERLPEIDQRLRTYAREWSLERMANVDRNILRLALYEMLYRDDVPLSVSINEAVEMAKVYSTPDSGRFINGILGKIAATLGGDDPGEPDGGAGRPASEEGGA